MAYRAMVALSVPKDIQSVFVCTYCIVLSVQGLTNKILSYPPPYVLCFPYIYVPYAHLNFYYYGTFSTIYPKVFGYKTLTQRNSLRLPWRKRVNDWGDLDLSPSAFFSVS